MEIDLPPELKPANFASRLAARIIDLVLITAFGYVLSLFFHHRAAHNTNYIAIGWLIGFFIYYPIAESRGGTIGKWSVSLVTLNIKTLKYPSLLSIEKRSLFLFSVGLIILPLGYILKYTGHVELITNIYAIYLYIILYILIFIGAPMAVLWTKNKQGYHDKFANVVVVTKKSYEEYLNLQVAENIVTI